MVLHVWCIWCYMHGVYVSIWCYIYGVYDATCMVNMNEHGTSCMVYVVLHNQGVYETFANINTYYFTFNLF